MKSCRWNSRKVVVGLALSSLILAGMMLSGCDLWYKDMKGYLEYWSSTVTVGELTWRSTPEHQKNSSGMYTIPTNAVVSVTASIENPDNYPLDSGVGSARDSLRSVRTAGTIGGTVRVTEATATSITAELIPHSFVPTSESRLLEHRDFTVTIAPTRTDNGMQAANPQELTLRYNTPPRMPLEVVENNGQFSWLGPDPWEISQSGSNKDAIFWAWPADKTKSGGGDPTDPDYVEYFYLTDDTGTIREPEEDWLFPDKDTVQTITGEDGAVYNIYWYIPEGQFTVCAVDGEGVASLGTVSGRSPHKITLNGSGGTFEDAKTQVEMYKAGGSLVSGGDLETPVRPGHYLSGWAVAQGGEPVAFPYEVTKEAALYALWEEDRVLQNGINRKTGEYEKPAQDTNGSYQVANAGNLLWIGQQMNNGILKAFNLKLTADIVIPSGTWKPIYTPDGNASIFDGQGHSITLDEKGGGLFEYIGYSTIKNLVLKGEIRVNTTGNVGAVTGSAYETKIENVMSEVTITNLGTGQTGGLVGVFGGKLPTTNPAVPKNSFIKNCAVYANVTSAGSTGGLVGMLWGPVSPGTISDSVYMGDVGGSPGGAIVGSRNSDYSSSLSDIFYCETGGLSPIGDDSSGLPNVVSKTKEQIASDDTATLLNTGLQTPQWEFKQGAKYPTLKQPTP